MTIINTSHLGCEWRVISVPPKVPHPPPPWQTLWPEYKHIPHSIITLFKLPSNKHQVMCLIDNKVHIWLALQQLSYDTSACKQYGNITSLYCFFYCCKNGICISYLIYIFQFFDDEFQSCFRIAHAS